MDGERIYCSDTSALVWLQRNIDTSAMRDMWDAVEELISTNRLFAPSQVRDEIDKGWDSLGAWVRRFPKLIREPIDEVANMVGDLGTAHPGFVKPLEVEDEADPWVVAWAKYENDRLLGELFGGECIVVSSEGYRPNHISHVCKAENITCIRLQEVFVREGWTFTRSPKKAD